MKNQYLHIITALLFCASISSCYSDGSSEIRGSIDNGITQLEFSQPGIHYKYAEPEVTVVDIDEEGTFSLPLDIEKPQVYYLVLFNERYPIYTVPGRRTNVSIQINKFPLDVKVRGTGRDLNESYQNYLEQIMNLERHARTERRNFLRGEDNEYLNMMRVRIQLAKEYLAEGPFDIYMLKNAGEYLVARLEEAKLKKETAGFDIALERKFILNEAHQLDFFTLDSFLAQRAGIRDFADAWSKTFGVQERIEEEQGRPLMEYDWKRLGFEELYAIKRNLLDEIQQEKARTHAEMYLLAELIGEGSFSLAAEELDKFKEQHETEERYITFLNNIYTDVSSIQPGNPAPEFNIADDSGEFVQLKDFRGKYVLLDFWATWCVPCLDEFPSMENIYETYSRDNLEIISISIDEERHSWEMALQRYDHPWVQLYAGEGFSQETFQEFRAGGIPFYVLIDRNGEILRVNDIRPSFNFSEIFEDILDHERLMTFSEY